MGGFVVLASLEVEQHGGRFFEVALDESSEVGDRGAVDDAVVCGPGHAEDPLWHHPPVRVEPRQRLYPSDCRDRNLTRQRTARVRSSKTKKKKSGNKTSGGRMRGEA